MAEGAGGGSGGRGVWVGEGARSVNASCLQMESHRPGTRVHFICLISQLGRSEG